MLTEGEIRALTALHGEQTVSELATNIDRSLSYTSELVDRSLTCFHLAAWHGEDAEAITDRSGEGSKQ